MPSDDVLDALPLEVLMALQELLADPSEEGRERAALRARDAGWHLSLAPGAPATPPELPPRIDLEPIPMEPAPDGVESLVLRFDRDDGRR
jgi:hypothetical protein